MVSALNLSIINIFKGLNDDQLNKMAELGKESYLKAGAICFTQGEKAEKLHLCISGTIDIKFWLQPWGIDVTVHTAKDGEAFGVSALIEPYIYVNTAQCVTESLEMTINRSDLLSLFKEDPKTGYTVFNNLLSVMKSNLQEEQDKISGVS
jgi:CRP-like cAMP-binding protein